MKYWILVSWDYFDVALIILINLIDFIYFVFLIFLVPRFREGEAGAHVLTPFELSKNGDRILINRGWVPRNKQNPSQRPEGQITGEVPVVGLCRLSEPKKVVYSLAIINIYHYPLHKPENKT